MQKCTGFLKIMKNTFVTTSVTGYKLSETEQECNLSTAAETDHFDKFFMMSPHLLQLLDWLRVYS